jgi:CubicO group peptidase (beta-lactamase class C family)
MVKILKRILQVILALAVLLTAFILISGRTYLFKAIWYNFAAIDDYKHFPNDTVRTARPQPWANSSRYNQISYPDSLDAELQLLQSVGLVMIQDDSVLYEKYWDGYSDSSYSGSFSMAKSIVSLLIGAALKDGKIASLEDPVGKYIPEFRDGAKAGVTIKDLLTMSSGSNWDESYWNPLSVTAEIYYTSDVYKTATGVKIVRTPGTQHRYKSGDAQLLGLILEKATGKTLAALAFEKLWGPMGAAHPALWSTDRPGGNEKSYCCFNSNARDFARLGQLMLDSGKWNGTPVIDSAYWAASIHPCNIPDEKGQPCTYYGYQWWIDPVNPQVFYARGILGQYIIVIPSKKRVIVRLGKRRSPDVENTMPKEVRDLINWGLE